MINPSEWMSSDEQMEEDLAEIKADEILDYTLFMVRRLQAHKKIGEDDMGVLLNLFSDTCIMQDLREAVKNETA